MNPKTHHLLDALPAVAAFVVATGEAILGVLGTTPGLTVPLGVLAGVRIAIAVARILETPPKT